MLGRPGTGTGAAVLPIRVMTMRLLASSPSMSGPEPAGAPTGPGELVTVGLGELLGGGTGSPRPVPGPARWGAPRAAAALRTAAAADTPLLAPRARARPRAP